MEQVNLDRKKIITKLKTEYRYDDRKAKLMADRLEAVHPDLIPTLAAWCKGEFLDYTFQTMSISLFMKIHEQDYLPTVIWMDKIVKNPENLKLAYMPLFGRR